MRRDPQSCGGLCSAGARSTTHDQVSVVRQRVPNDLDKRLAAQQRRDASRTPASRSACRSLDQSLHAVECALRVRLQRGRNRRSPRQDVRDVEPPARAPHDACSTFNRASGAGRKSVGTTTLRNTTALVMAGFFVPLLGADHWTQGPLPSRPIAAWPLSPGHCAAAGIGVRSSPWEGRHASHRGSVCRAVKMNGKNDEGVILKPGAR